MATTIALNLIAAIAVATALASVCRFAYAAADGRVDEQAPTAGLAPRHELERAA